MTQSEPATPAEPARALSTTSIFNLIHDLHQTITASIDTSLTWDQLNSPAINYTLVRPIIDRLLPDNEANDTAPKQSMSASGLLDIPGDQEAAIGSPAKTETCLGAVLFALMANRMQFISLGDGDLSYAPLQSTRAAFCELLAIKVMRKIPHPEDEAQFAAELVRGYCAFDGAPESVWQTMGDDRSEVEETRSSALEMAIVTTSKHFLSLPIVQHLIREIYVGHLIYHPSSSGALIDDSYISERTKKKRQPSHSNAHRPRPSPPTNEDEKLAEVYLYNPYEAGWLDHGRLRVPKWRKWLEFASFSILLALFIATLSFKNLDQVTAVEVTFMVFTAGFMLDEFAASHEHGWVVYSANAWNLFDLSYIAVFLLYFALRIIGLASHHPPTSDLAFDILACSACILFPRLVFFVLKDNVLILALRAMISRYVNFMALVIFAFSGICFCLWTLGRGTWTVRQITWLMLQIWFGSSYLGFSSSESFHPLFGPIILISYAALCNTLLITILISILSNEFAEINANAQEEHMFQRVVKTVEGVRSDSIFSYLPPVNILALTILTPLSWVVSPRTLHRINVFCIRLTSFPYLLAISGWERWQYRSRRQIHLKGPEHIQRPSMFESFLGGGSEILISSVFEAGPPVDLKPATPQKASKTRQPEESSADADSADERQGWESPLAEIFGRSKRGLSRKGLARSTTSVAGSRVRDNKGGDEELVAARDEVDKFKEEVKAVRESQLRMEEMLAKVLAASK